MSTTLITAGLMTACVLPWTAVARAAGGHGAGHGRGSGRVVALLEGDVPREASIDRMQSLESPFTLAAGAWEWDIGLAEGTTTRIDTLHVKTVVGLPIEVRHGFGGRVDAALMLQPYEYQAIDPGPASDAVSAEGLGATTLHLRARLTASHEARLQTGIVFWTRIPGSAASPDTRVLEAGLALPVAVRLDPATLLGASASVQSVGGIVSQGRFLDGSATIGISRAVGDAVDLWGEVEGVWYGESPGARLVTANAGVTLDLFDHLAVTLGVAGGSAAGTRDSGMVASLRVHS